MLGKRSNQVPVFGPFDFLQICLNLRHKAIEIQLLSCLKCFMILVVCSIGILRTIFDGGKPQAVKNPRTMHSTLQCKGLFFSSNLGTQLI